MKLKRLFCSKAIKHTPLFLFPGIAAYFIEFCTTGYYNFWLFPESARFLISLIGSISMFIGLFIRFILED